MAPLFRFLVFSCFAVTVVTSSVTAQGVNELSLAPLDSVAGPQGASILFDRNQNTFNWSGALSLDTSVAGTRFSVKERYTSNIILLDASPAGPERLQSNQQTVALSAAHPLTKNFSARAGWSSLVYSDNKAVGLSTASSHAVIGGMDYAPLPELILSPLVGYRWDNQGTSEDQGLHYILGASTPGITGEGFLLRGDAQFHEDRLAPRTLEAHFARAQMEKTFEGQTRDSLQAGFSRNRREFYSLAGTTAGIDSRIENVFSLGNLLDYEIGPRWVTSLFLTLTSRTLEKNTRAIAGGTVTTPSTDIDELSLETFLQARYSSGSLNAFARLHYTERNESHSSAAADDNETVKNNNGKWTALAGAAEFPLSRSDTLEFSGSASILRYDTPSRENTEDRDESQFAFSLVSRHAPSRYLSLGIGLHGTLGHTVYLLRERSGNNNFNRVLRLSPWTVFRPFRNFSSTNVFEVLANYTVYDFEEQAASIRSFSYRQFGWLDTSAIELTSRVGLDFLSILKLYERGQLRWADFKERTENSFVDQTYALQARFQASEAFMVAVGFRYFSQTRYSFGDRGKVLDTIIRSVGPTCVLLWRAGTYGEVGFRGWYEHRSQTVGRGKDLANMSMSVLLNF